MARSRVRHRSYGGGAIPCVVRAVTRHRRHPGDDLDCLELTKGEAVRDDKVAFFEAGIVSQRVTPTADGYAVTYEARERGHTTGVFLPSVKCPPRVPAK